jgi:4-cresol dehydrogenase (hydroxylating)
VIEKMKSTLRLGYWNLYGTVYGPPPIMDITSP